MHETNSTRIFAVRHRVGAKKTVVSWGPAFGFICLSRLLGPSLGGAVSRRPRTTNVSSIRYWQSSALLP